MQNKSITTRVVNITSISLIAAMLALILYWVFTGSLEDIETIYIAAGIALLLGANLWLARRGQTQLAAWLIIGLLVFLNAANIIWYGIGTTSTAALLIPIVVAAIGLGARQGYIVTALSLLIVWGTVLASAAGQAQTEIPYQVSNLTFDAPLLTIVFIFIAVLTAQARK